MLRSNMEGLRRSVGPHALETVKTFECYFLRLSEPAGLNEEERIRRRLLCNKDNENLEQFNEEDNDRK